MALGLLVHISIDPQINLKTVIESSTFLQVKVDLNGVFKKPTTDSGLYFYLIIIFLCLAVSFHFIENKFTTKFKSCSYYCCLKKTVLWDINLCLKIELSDFSFMAFVSTRSQSNKHTWWEFCCWHERPFPFSALCNVKITNDVNTLSSVQNCFFTGLIVFVQVYIPNLWFVFGTPQKLLSLLKHHKSDVYKLWKEWATVS